MCSLNLEVLVLVHLNLAVASCVVVCTDRQIAGSPKPSHLWPLPVLPDFRLQSCQQQQNTRLIQPAQHLNLNGDRHLFTVTHIVLLLVDNVQEPIIVPPLRLRRLTASTIKVALDAWMPLAASKK